MVRESTGRYCGSPLRIRLVVLSLKEATRLQRSDTEAAPGTSNKPSPEFSTQDIHHEALRRRLYSSRLRL